MYTTVSAAFINNESTLGLFRLIIKYIKIHDFSDIKEIEWSFFCDGPVTISDCDKQHSQLDGCRGEIELSVWFFYREEGENLETVGRHDTAFSKPTVMNLVEVVVMMVALLLPRRLFSS